MQIIKAEQNDLNEILNLVQECIKDMNNAGITQWNEQYPPNEIFWQDIKINSLYTLKINGELVGIIVLSDKQEEQYESIQWKDASGKFLVIHRLAVHPKWQRKGYAEKLLDFAEDFANRNGYTSIRIDTFSQNPRTIRLFEKRKYERKADEIHFPENLEPYYCYEKLL
jgi:ribosomal protein S18 acetylase RimI-like enzyme